MGQHGLGVDNAPLDIKVNRLGIVFSAVSREQCVSSDDALELVYRGIISNLTDGFLVLSDINDEVARLYSCFKRGRIVNYAYNLDGFVVGVIYYRNSLINVSKASEL